MSRRETHQQQHPEPLQAELWQMQLVELVLPQPCSACMMPGQQRRRRLSPGGSLCRSQSSQSSQSSQQHLSVPRGLCCKPLQQVGQYVKQLQQLMLVGMGLLVATAMKQRLT
jgi:hypothetical protein